MTALLRGEPAWLPRWERWRRSGGTLTTVRVTLSGQVKLHQVKVLARPTTQGYVELWPVMSVETVLGTVDPFARTAWCEAEHLVRAAGWVIDGHWSTMDRMPCARLARATQTPRGDGRRGRN